MKEIIRSGCMLCPRNCNTDRLTGKRGYCGESNTLRVARAALHFWEEPVICGQQGSGTVFFSGCNLKCIFCQNGSIASGQVGLEITVERLSEIFMELEAQGAENINLVTATHYVPQIAEAILMARQKGLRLPIIYNTSSYEKVETLRLLEGLVDIYLPDMKYMDGELAGKYSGAENYPEVSKDAIAEMFRQVGRPVWDEESGLMCKGMIVRHLIMPTGVKNTKQVLNYLYDTYGDDIYISIMNQYTPMRKFVNYPELNRRVTKREYERVITYALDKGIENAFIQENGAAQESFIPEFDYTGIRRNSSDNQE